MKLIDLEGRRFNRLVVLKRDENLNGHPAWLCKCDCGNECVVAAGHLLQNRTQSCGCLRTEGIILRSTTHGEAVRGGKSRLYKVYRNMIARCYNSNVPQYKNYGGRGITVCDEWKNSYPKFKEWAMKNGYDENAEKGVCTIDRIDNDSGYAPNNCRWVDAKTQSRNRRCCLSATSG